MEMYRVKNESSEFFKQVGRVTERRRNEIQLKFKSYPRPMWFASHEVESYECDMTGWKVGQRVVTQLNDEDVTGSVSYVGKGYVKVLINEGDYKNRELVRHVDEIVKISKTIMTEIELTYKSGEPGFRSHKRHTFNTMEEVIEHLKEAAKSGNLSDIFYQEIEIHRNEIKEIKMTVSFDY